MRSIDQRQLDGENRLERSILCSFYPSRISEPTHFLWDDKSFRFTCLPFGFSYVPRVFTKVMKPVVAYLRA